MADSLFTSKDIEILDKNIEKIQEDLDKIRKNLFPEVPVDSKLLILEDVKQFVKDKKRKMYGGYALNELMKLTKGDPIYEECTLNDIDFYSPRPVDDLIDLCDLLNAKKYGKVQGKEAVHGESYTIYVNEDKYCDISYTPPNIYNKMPFKNTADGLTLIHPHFMWIDYLRMLTEPINSWWRIEKSYKRFFLLQKYYSYPINLSPIEIDQSNKDLKSVLQNVMLCLKNKDTIITIGFCAYNYFLRESGLVNQTGGDKGGRGDKGKGRNGQNFSPNFKYIDVPFYEYISTNYKEDALELLKKLKDLYPEEGVISYKEYYPFLQYTGDSTDFYYKNEYDL